MTTLAIEYLPLAQLSPYARNSRTHSDEQLAVLAHSIRTYGFNSPVLIDADGGIIAGHGRVQAAARAGLDTVPCIRLGHLTDAQKRAYVIADNRAYELGGWDFATLASEVEDLMMDAEAEIDIADLGFDEDAFGALSAWLPDIEPTPEKPVSRRGPTNEDEDEPGAGEDRRDIGEGALNASEGKAITYPLILQLNKPTFQRWRKFKGQRSDTEATTQLLDIIAALQNIDVLGEDLDVAAMIARLEQPAAPEASA